MERLTAAGRGESSIVVLSGEPGVGKTRLLTELADHAAANGWQVLVGQALDSEGMPPYLPFVEALHEHVRACTVHDLRAQLGEGAPEVAHVLPEVAHKLPDLATSTRLEAAQPLKDKLRGIQRAALVAYRVAHPPVDPMHKPPLWHDVHGLYEYALIDVEMSPCMMTTRIKQAISFNAAVHPALPHEPRAWRFPNSQGST
jgi:hypothetical protein